MKPRLPASPWLLIALVCLDAAPLMGQIEPGRVYDAGARVEDPAAGLAVTLPSGWRGALAPDGSAFVMEADAGDGYLFIIGEEATEGEVRAELARSIDLGDGIVLSPSGPVRELAPGVRCPGRSTVHGRAALAPRGERALLVALSATPPSG